MNACLVRMEHSRRICHGRALRQDLAVSSWFSGDCFNGRRFVIVAVSFVCLRFPCEKE
jgi:hypothetical protein